MDVKEAVAAAKNFIAELFAQENITRLGLEEVEFDEREGEWRVTVVFSRPWDAASALLSITQQATRRDHIKSSVFLTPPEPPYR